MNCYYEDACECLTCEQERKFVEEFEIPDPPELFCKKHAEPECMHCPNPEDYDC